MSKDMLEKEFSDDANCEELEADEDEGNDEDIGDQSNQEVKVSRTKSKGKPLVNANLNPPLKPKSNSNVNAHSQVLSQSTSIIPNTNMNAYHLASALPQAQLDQILQANAELREINIEQTKLINNLYAEISEEFIKVKGMVTGLTNALNEFIRKDQANAENLQEKKDQRILKKRLNLM